MAEGWERGFAGMYLAGGVFFTSVAVAAIGAVVLLISAVSYLFDRHDVALVLLVLGIVPMLLSGIILVAGLRSVALRMEEWEDEDRSSRRRPSRAGRVGDS